MPLMGYKFVVEVRCLDKGVVFAHEFLQVLVGGDRGLHFSKRGGRHIEIRLRRGRRRRRRRGTSLSLSLWLSLYVLPVCGCNSGRCVGAGDVGCLFTPKSSSRETQFFTYCVKSRHFVICILFIYTKLS